MSNVITRWIKKNKPNSKVATLEGVAPLHPADYPARHLKEKLDARREEMDEIEGRVHSGMPEGPGGF